MSIEKQQFDNHSIIIYSPDGSNTYTLGSMYYPDRFQDIWAGSHLSDYHHPTYLVFGVGDGSFLSALLKKADDDSVFVVYEPSREIFDFSCREFSWGELLTDNRINAYCELSDNELSMIFSHHIGYYDVKGCVVCVHPGYQFIFKNELRIFRNLLNARCQEVGFSADMLYNSGKFFASDFIKCLKTYETSYTIDDLKQFFPTDIPVLIAASGPSLDKALPSIKKAKGHMIILSVDSALPSLLKHDIVPDLFISVDPGKEMSNFTDDRVNDIPGIFTFTSRGEIFQNHRAPKFFYSSDQPLINDLNDEFGLRIPVLNANGSVSNHAFLVMSYLRFETIVFAGLDLAYRNGRTHSQDALLGNEISYGSINDYMINDPYGNTIYTSIQLNIYRLLLEKDILACPYSKVINTSFGADIKGAFNMEMTTVCKKYCGHVVDYDFLLPASIKDFSVLFNTLIKLHEEFRIKVNAILQNCDDLNDFADVLHELVSSPRLGMIYHNSFPDLRDILVDIRKKEPPAAILNKYRECFKVILSSCNLIIDMENKIYLYDK